MLKPKHIISLGPDCAVVQPIRRLRLRENRTIPLYPLENTWQYDPYRPGLTSGAGHLGEIVATLIEDRFEGFLDNLRKSYRGAWRAARLSVEFAHHNVTRNPMRQKYQKAIERFLRVLDGTDEVLFVSSLRAHALDELTFKGVKSTAFVNADGIRRLHHILATNYPKLPFSLLQIILDYPDAERRRRKVLAQAVDDIPDLYVGDATIVRDWRKRKNGWYGVPETWEANFHDLGLTK